MLQFLLIVVSKFSTVLSHLPHISHFASALSHISSGLVPSPLPSQKFSFSDLSAQNTLLLASSVQAPHKNLHTVWVADVNKPLVMGSHTLYSMSSALQS
jgi:hypothetical protein